MEFAFYKLNKNMADEQNVKERFSYSECRGIRAAEKCGRGSRAKGKCARYAHETTAIGLRNPKSDTGRSSLDGWPAGVLSDNYVTFVDSWGRGARDGERIANMRYLRVETASLLQC